MIVYWHKFWTINDHWLDISLVQGLGFAIWGSYLSWCIQIGPFVIEFIW